MGSTRSQLLAFPAGLYENKRDHLRGRPSLFDVASSFTVGRRQGGVRLHVPYLSRLRRGMQERNKRFAETTEMADNMIFPPPGGLVRGIVSCRLLLAARHSS